MIAGAHKVMDKVIVPSFTTGMPITKAGKEFICLKMLDVLAKPIEVKNGVAQMPTGPGLGIKVDEAKVLELMRKTK